MFNDLIHSFDKIIPVWAVKLPFHVKGFILFFVVIHIVGILGATTYAVMNTRREGEKPDFKAKIT
jgi:hypothetical protein